MSKINIKPLGDRVVLKSVKAEEKTAGGLFIPDSAQEKPQKAEVVAVGSGTDSVKMELKVGDTVIYSKFAGLEITIDGEDYLILQQSDILAII